MERADRQRPHQPVAQPESAGGHLPRQRRCARAELRDPLQRHRGGLRLRAALEVSGDTAYADKAVQYLDAWSSKLTLIGGDTNAALAAGIYGYEFANAGEIMRGYAGWTASGLAAFQKMMRNVFYPINHDFLNRHNNTEVTHYWANWDLCNLASVLAIGVLCDDASLFDEAIAYFKGGAGNGCIGQAVYYVHPGYLGQWQETGRDQGHNTLGIALGGAICEMAWNQGVDLYGFDNNRFLAGAEYVAKANLIESGSTYHTVPYVTYRNVDVTQTAFSTAAQGTVRPCWALVANHYINRKGLAAPYSKQFAAQIQPEGGGGNYGPNSGGYDQLGYGTLTCTRDASTPAAAPSGLTGHATAGSVALSWWGCSHATGYTVKRATIAGGPYTVVASGITDLLSWTDTPPAAGTYYYVATAQTASGESAASNEVKVVTAIRLHTELSFSEGSGTVAADSSGNGHAGTLAGGAAWATGRSGHAVSLSVGAYVALPADLLADVSDCTLSAWVFWTAAQTNTRIFDFGSGTGHYLMLTPRHGSGAGAVRCAITVNGRFGEQSIDGTAALPAGQWVHVAVTLSGSTGTLYVNGTAVGTNTAMFLAPFRLGSTTQNWLGRSQYSADPGFNGLIDDFRIHRGALSATQIAELMRN
ncbi:LamG-like jellyroll fold domain-containing protein [Ralstonia pseudosolanacearum]|uniref:LamG-like jellyroll fold domain-containing protein n=1 Tax=Ralstonia pseudosolanacearum TaxID=1310165 RepID=UPI003CED551B